MGALVGAPRDVLVPRGDLGMLMEPPGALGWENRELERGWEIGSGGFGATWCGCLQHRFGLSILWLHQLGL